MAKKKAFFRFYASLNDFLPVEDRQKATEYTYWGSPTVKDAIEAQGVPHVEVDLVLVNSSPAKFDYKLQPGDTISVYPTFRNIDLADMHQTKKSKPDNRFVVDAHLGKLAKYLRMLGFDALYDNRFSDPEIIQLSLDQGRIILTRDLGILKNGKVQMGYFLRSTNPHEQLREVFDLFNLSARLAPFSRCMKCNGLLLQVEKDAIVTKLENQTSRDFDEFYQCQHCKQIYWKGSHYERMLEMMTKLQD